MILSRDGGKNTRPSHRSDMLEMQSEGFCRHTIQTADANYSFLAPRRRLRRRLHPWLDLRTSELSLCRQKVAGILQATSSAKHECTAYYPCHVEWQLSM